jgi:hypothetical protein
MDGTSFVVFVHTRAILAVHPTGIDDSPPPVDHVAARISHQSTTVEDGDESVVPMKPIRFSKHARDQMALRGASEVEVIDAIRTGSQETAKRGRLGFRKDFTFGRVWARRHYATKQVLAIVSDEPTEIVVITVYTFYF